MKSAEEMAEEFQYNYEYGEAEAARAGFLAGFASRDGEVEEWKNKKLSAVRQDLREWIDKLKHDNKQLNELLNAAMDEIHERDVDELREQGVDIPDETY